MHALINASETAYKSGEKLVHKPHISAIARYLFPSSQNRLVLLGWDEVEFIGGNFPNSGGLYVCQYLTI